MICFERRDGMMMCMYSVSSASKVGTDLKRDKFLDALRQDAYIWPVKVPFGRTK